MDQYARIRDQLIAKQAELENAEVVDALGNEARNEISKIAKALDQIKTGTYGICADCGERIPMARLEAHPFADRCIRCATAAEGGRRLR